VYTPELGFVKLVLFPHQSVLTDAVRVLAMRQLENPFPDVCGHSKVCHEASAGYRCGQQLAVDAPDTVTRI
jgi:hypothetical protein